MPPLDPTDQTPLLRFDNSYARLPDKFYARVAPTPVAAPTLVKLNAELAARLGLAEVPSADLAEAFSGNRIAAGSQPLAMAYAGHQFGNFVRQLGDGRANLLGEVIGSDGSRYDVQLKGAGPTPFSRNGDGRATLAAVLREYILSEAMAALGVPTTRALAVVATGQTVWRETALPGAVLTRVAASHLRVGTFQYFLARQDIDGLRVLADYAIARHYPEAASSARPYRALLDGVIARQARLVAQWLMLGFIHGVMNTDNTSISGETIDYGPCAFMEAYDTHAVFSSIDRQGRYGYGNQPHALHWNLTRLAETLLPLLVQEEGGDEAAMASAHEALHGFGELFETARDAGVRQKLGLATKRPEDVALGDDLLQRMEENRADHTLTFRLLCDAAADGKGPRSLFADPAAFDAWEVRWRERLQHEAGSGKAESGEARAAQMRRVSPLYIPRNHLVEFALQAATERQDFAPFEELVTVLARPFDEQPGRERYATPARPEEFVHQTFCGT